MDYETAFLLLAVLIVLILACYIQANILATLAPKVKKKSGLKARLVSGSGKESLAAELLNLNDTSLDKKNLDSTSKLLAANMSKEDYAGLDFFKVIVDLLLYLLDLNVNLKEKFDSFIKIGEFNKKLHSSNLLSRLEIKEEFLQEKLDKLKILDTKKEVINKIKIIYEHVKMIDQIFSDAGILENYIKENMLMLNSRFLEIRALARELFSFLNKLNPEMLEEHEELDAFMKKHQEYFKIKTEK